MKRSLFYGLTLFVIALLSGILVMIAFCTRVPPTPSLADAQGRGFFDLRAHWARGDVVVLLRHTERCDRSDNPCLDGDTGITVPGERMARQLGAHFRRLSLDNAKIYNSPLKRARQTAVLAFGERSESRPWLSENCKKSLYRDILAHKVAGKNLLLVTHSTCIKMLQDNSGQLLLNIDIGDDSAYGAAVFFAVNTLTDPAHLYVLGHLYPGEWASLPHHMPVANMIKWLDTPSIFLSRRALSQKSRSPNSPRPG